MSFPSPATLRSRAVLTLFFLALAALPACAKKSSTATGGGPPSCLVFQSDGGISSGNGTATGTVEGPSASASFCSLGVSLQPTGSSTSHYVLNIDSTVAGASSRLESPAAGTAATLTGSLGLASAAPGVYRSSGAGQCGQLSFSYGVPLASEANCAAADAQAFSCPTGCTPTSLCTSPPCCLPLATTYIYESNAASGCVTGPNTPLGSWTVTLTSAVATDAGFGQVAYAPHGTLEATLQGTTDATDTTTVSLTF